MSDETMLVERLRGRARFCKDRGEEKTPDLMYEAADEIERLRAARSAVLENAAKVADTEAQRRHEAYLACKVGSQEWGYEPEASAMAQGNKRLTALEIAAAIRALKEIS
jgi:hypothetical protein